LEDARYPLDEMIYDLANLDAGFRFAGEETAGPGGWRSHVIMHSASNPFPAIWKTVCHPNTARRGSSRGGRAQESLNTRWVLTDLLGAVTSPHHHRMAGLLRRLRTLPNSIGRVGALFRRWPGPF